MSENNNVSPESAAHSPIESPSHMETKANAEKNQKPLATIAPRPSQESSLNQNSASTSSPPSMPSPEAPSQALSVPPATSSSDAPKESSNDTTTITPKAKPTAQVVDPKRKYKIWTIPDGGTDGLSSSDRFIEFLLNDNGKNLAAMTGSMYQGQPVKEKKSTALIRCVQYFQDKGVDFRSPDHLRAKLQLVLKDYWTANRLDKTRRTEAAGKVVPTNEKDLEDELDAICPKYFRFKEVLGDTEPIPSKRAAKPNTKRAKTQASTAKEGATRPQRSRIEGGSEKMLAPKPRDLPTQQAESRSDASSSSSDSEDENSSESKDDSSRSPSVDLPSQTSGKKRRDRQLTYLTKAFEPEIKKSRKLMTELFERQLKQSAKRDIYRAKLDFFLELAKHNSWSKEESQQEVERITKEVYGDDYNQ